jgi:two-component system, OmpR family, sensor kinase
VSRIPLRWRLTLAFALAMAIVLTLLGAFLYVRLERSLTAGIDETLDLRTAAIAADLRHSSSVDVGPVGEDSIAQVFDGRGGLLASSPPGQRPLLGPADVGRGVARSFTTRSDAVRALDGEAARVLVTPVHRGRREEVVLAVGVSVQDRDDALGSLLAQLLVVGPLALVLASVGGYFLAAAALRPVESMRREAEVVTASEPGRRLTLPPAHDEIRRLGETLNAMLAKLESALERERRFVADASHELRTPLALLRAELELALRRDRAPAELTAALRSAAEETERLSRLAEDLLVLARAEGGTLPVRRAPVAAGALLSAVAERFAARAATEGRSIEVSEPYGLTVSVDRMRIEQALGNLVDNAFRHGRGRVRLDARDDDGVVLEVSDEGPGPPLGFAEQAFEPFARGDSARTGPGAGLGLAIVDAIARAHGGSAHLGSGAGGTVAWIELPKPS